MADGTGVGLTYATHHVVTALTGENGVSDKAATQTKYKFATRRNCS